MSKVITKTPAKRVPKARAGVNSKAAQAAAEVCRVVAALKAGTYAEQINADDFQDSELMSCVSELVAMYRQEAAKSQRVTGRISRVAERVEQLRSLCITNLGRATEAMADGDLKFEIITGTPFFEIDSDDEIGQLENSINGIIKQTQGTVAAFQHGRATVLGVIEETTGLTRAARDGNIGARTDASKFKGAYLELSQGANDLLEVVVTRVREIAERVEKLRGLCITNLGKATEAMAAGDLKFEIMTGTDFLKIDSQDELGMLAESVNGIIKQTQGTVASFEKGRTAMLSVIDETNGVSIAAQNGNINARADSKKFQGAYGELLQGVNGLLDVIGSRVKTVAERVEQLRGLCITNLGRATQAMAEGDLKFEIVTGTPFFEVNSEDTIGKLEESINGIIKQTQGTVAAFEVSRSTLLELIVSDGGAALNAAASKDLTRRVEKEYRGEYDKMKDNINSVLNNLDEAFGQVSVAAEQVTSAASEISAGSQALAQGTSEQASSLEEVTSSLQELASMTKQNTANAKEARSLSDGARASAQRGTDNMRRLSEAIDKIKASSDATAKIIKTIDEIAFQTNLLALNAAVEAARAGDAGKGFAVVAEEVRNLAMRSAEAAKNTANMIEESVKNAEGGVAFNQEVSKNLDEINEQAKKVSEMMAEIAAASDQQTLGVEQINTAVEQVNEVTQQAAANSEESASAAEELTGQAEELLNMIGTFQLSGEGHPGANRGASRTSTPRTHHMMPARVAAKKPAVAFAGARMSSQTNGNGRNGNGKSYAATKKLIPFDEDDEVLRDF